MSAGQAWAGVPGEGIGEPAPPRRLGLNLTSSTWTSKARLRRPRDNSGGKRKGGGEASAAPEEEGVRPLEEPALREEESLQSLGPKRHPPSGSGWGPVPAGHPPSRPCPGLRRSFLPVFLHRKLQIPEIDGARASRPFIDLASQGGNGARTPVSGRASGEPQPRSATHSLAAPAPATGQEKRFGLPEFRKVSRRLTMPTG